MKAISSAIVAAAGLFGMSVNHAIFHGFPQLLAFIASVVALALGLVGWWAALKNER